MFDVLEPTYEFFLRHFVFFHVTTNLKIIGYFWKTSSQGVSLMASPSCHLKAGSPQWSEVEGRALPTWASVGGDCPSGFHSVWKRSLQPSESLMIKGICAQLIWEAISPLPWGARRTLGTLHTNIQGWDLKQVSSWARNRRNGLFNRQVTPCMIAGPGTGWECIEK